MKFKKYLALLIVFVLFFSTVGTALADEEDPSGTGTTGTTEVCVDETTGLEVPCPDDWVHPIVALLAAYMEYKQGPTEPEEPEVCYAEDGVTPIDCPEEVCYAEDGVTPIDCPLPLTPEEEIAGLHAEGVGFGVLVKLMTLSDKGDMSLTDLVAMFKAGQGFKQLYEDYGHPTAHGVGHIKQEMKCVDAGGVDCTNNHGKGKDKPKKNAP